MLEIAGWIVLLCLLSAGAIIIVALQNTLRLRFPNYRQQPFDIWHAPLPDALRDNVARLKPEIKALDFHLVATLKLPKISPDLPDLPCFIFQKNNDETTFLQAYPPDYQLSPNDFTLVLLTLCQDNSRAYTYSHQNFVLEPPLANELSQSVNHFDPYYVVTMHEALLNQYQKQPYYQPFNAAEICTLINHIMLQRLDTRLATGNFRLYHTPNSFYSHYRYKFWYATWMLLFDKSSKVEPSLLHGVTEMPIPPARQQLYLQQFLDSKNIELDASDKLTFFLLTCFLSYFIGLLMLDSMTILSLILVIFLHELGHFLAMKWAGYKNATIYMLPLLGGVTTGVQQKNSQNREIWVLLAGPLPGLLLSFGIFMILSFRHLAQPLPHYFIEFLIQLALVNGFNLLPILPLDGGKLFQITFSGKALSIGKCLAVVISLLAISFAIFMLESFIMTVIFALPLVILLKKSAATPLPPDILIKTDDDQATILKKLCRQEPGILAFREHLQTSYDLFMQSNHTPAYKLNKVVIMGILLFNPIIVYLCLMLSWSVS